VNNVTLKFELKAAVTAAVTRTTVCTAGTFSFCLALIDLYETKYVGLEAKYCQLIALMAL